MDALIEEEQLVAELERLDIRYLSRQTAYQAERLRPPAALLADLVRQPSARVRAAVIAVLLAYPEYADAMPEALAQLGPPEQLTLRLFYTASVLLQQEYASALQPFVAERWRWLPDLFSADLQVPDGGQPSERLVKLGQAHRRKTKAVANWAGTHENVARKLVHAWKLERSWNQ